MLGAIPPLSSTPSWHVARLKKAEGQLDVTGQEENHTGKRMVQRSAIDDTRYFSQYND